MTDPDRRLENLGPRGWMLLAASAFALGGMAAGGPIIVAMDLSTTLISRTVSDPLRTILAIGAVGGGTFASGTLLWWAIIERPRTASRLRGVRLASSQ